MSGVKKGDIVGRISYGKDIAFVVERIIKTKDNKKIAILKGLTIRVQADSDIEDLELMEQKQIEQHERVLEESVAKRIQKYAESNLNSEKEKHLFREKTIIYTGKILHIDGDRKYSEKSRNYYRKIGLNAIVKNIPERMQPLNIVGLLQRHKPDVLVITGHDRYDSKRNKIQ